MLYTIEYSLVERCDAWLFLTSSEEAYSSDSVKPDFAFR